jgi:cell wall-associated NlpC family hydrolase
VLEEGAALRRFLLTGTLAFAISGGVFGIAAADETNLALASPAMTGTAAQVPEGPPVSAAVVAAAKKRLAALEAAAPTQGADLAMWGVQPQTAAEKAEGPGGAVRRFASGIINRGATIAVNLTRNAMKFLGTPYAFGGTSAGGFDCSGYVQHVFAMLGIHLPRTADAQYVAGRHIKGSMEPGDLVFFQTYEPGASHVGIYLGESKFIHASSSHGVMVSSLHDSYWSARYLGAKRVVN